MAICSILIRGPFNVSDLILMKILQTAKGHSPYMGGLDSGVLHVSALRWPEMECPLTEALHSIPGGIAWVGPWLG